MGLFRKSRVKGSGSTPQASHSKEAEKTDVTDQQPLSIVTTPQRAPPDILTHAASSDQSGNGRPPNSDIEEACSSTGSDIIRDIKCEILANWLHTKQQEKIWTSGAVGEGVFVKRSKGNYAYAPQSIAADGSNLCQLIVKMNLRCAMTVNTSVIRHVLQRTDVPYVQIRSGLRLQVIPDFEALLYCQRGQSAAFVASHQLLIVWQDDPKLLIERADIIINSLMRMICGDEYGSPEDGQLDEITGQTAWSGMAEYNDTLVPGEMFEDPHRKLKLWQSIYTGISIMLMTTCIGSGFREVAIQHIQDPNWFRMFFVFVVPAQAWLSLFFFQAIVGNIAQIVGPTDQMKENSKYYSGKAPLRLHRDMYMGSLPHVTIQMPVYREGLRGVIEPTVRSIKDAISTYELQGGKADLFVNDDGMQLISKEEAKERREFYEENDIGWVARPRHNPDVKHGPKEFHRRGKFKKASNMNYALRLSVRVEDLLMEVERHGAWNQMDENAAYDKALETAITEREGETWADGSIRVGDYILLIDSDTRIPNDCLLEAVSEMEISPQVAILQYSSGVMNVTDNFFEKGITFFTNMIYTMIRFAVAGGDVAPFVGHNAILRWSAMQEIAYHCKHDDYEKYWSEETVSEDFDMSLRLQAEGYIVRLGSYKKDGYKEGVSLTVYDELARWEKYAYGCNELIFHPLKHWPTKGPVTPLFRTFIVSNMPIASKITIMAYIGTYYAIGSAWLLTLLNYFLIGFFNGVLDHFYTQSFRVYFALIFVFTILGNFALAVLRYRIEESGLIAGLWMNLKWIPLLTVFLGGVSLHVSQALVCHFLSIDMEWGATTKEHTDVSFYQAMKDVGAKFKWSFGFCFVIIGVMLGLRYAVAEEWRIDSLVAVWPMITVVVNHALLPVILNPQLMTCKW
ncbi:hypothetical protein T440DRAFT_500482 [Plenodomus tracheiphilus IPT5]|uniref:Uncharacterized protein n=1 Tax=Plenodomus tracheiphilus IPT5 TaxID=1408161 RepID=A0A6A7AZ69_9PLEO|nr:hypothetical protein T440DRAFT_500482 [Plenodomus tracheiphilus IPT5]